MRKKYRALEEVPDKYQAYVLLECSRLEEFKGNLDTARQLLTRARRDTKNEWKVYLESVLIEMRSGHVNEAIEQAQVRIGVVVFFIFLKRFNHI